MQRPSGSSRRRRRCTARSRRRGPVGGAAEPAAASSAWTADECLPDVRGAGGQCGLLGRERDPRRHRDRRRPSSSMKRRCPARPACARDRDGGRRSSIGSLGSRIQSSSGSASRGGSASGVDEEEPGPAEPGEAASSVGICVASGGARPSTRPGATIGIRHDPATYRGPFRHCSLGVARSRQDPDRYLTRPESTARSPVRGMRHDRRGMAHLVTAIIKPHRLDAVKDALRVPALPVSP